jgi:hypothetical protein
MVKRGKDAEMTTTVAGIMIPPSHDAAKTIVKRDLGCHPSPPIARRESIPFSPPQVVPSTTCGGNSINRIPFGKGKPAR